MKFRSLTHVLLACFTLPTMAGYSPSFAGDPSCPSVCSHQCTISPNAPTGADTTCVEIEAQWTRIQHGCAAEPPACEQCRVCLARMLVIITASSSCVSTEGGYVKTAWSTTTTPPGGPMTSTGSGTGALAPFPDGSASSRDLKDVTANCGATSAYTVTITTGASHSESRTATFGCDSCQ